MWPAADPNANEQMIREQIVARGVRDVRVLDAILSVPRDLFVPRHYQRDAFEDTPLPLERGQTISQPYIVALMTELLQLRGDERVLEIGTGSGYQTAILARVARHVYSAEIEPDLAATVLSRLNRLDITNVTLAVGDGIAVFRDRAPFDAILSAAAPATMPRALLEQLGEGGRCVIPIGAGDQDLWLIRKVNGELIERRLEPVKFVPLRTKS